jgi:hypothetical protein
MEQAMRQKRTWTPCWHSSALIISNLSENTERSQATAIAGGARSWYTTVSHCAFPIIFYCFSIAFRSVTEDAADAVLGYNHKQAVREDNAII